MRGPGPPVGRAGRGRRGAGLPAPLMPPPCTAVASSWQVSSFSETRAQQILQQKPAQYLRFNQHQLSRIYPSSYRVDSSNYNPQPFWNAGCQMGARHGAAGLAPWPLALGSLYHPLPVSPGRPCGGWGRPGPQDEEGETEARPPASPGVDGGWRGRAPGTFCQDAHTRPAHAQGCEPRVPAHIGEPWTRAAVGGRRGGGRPGADRATSPPCP